MRLDSDLIKCLKTWLGLYFHKWRLDLDLINRLNTWQGPDLMTSGPTWTSFHELCLDFDLLQGLNTWCGLDLKTQNLTLTWSDVSWIHLDLNLCLCVVPDVLGGYNGTIFAYGQTSSGKTHTMEVSVPQTLYCYCCLSIDKPRSQSHRVNPVTFISSSRLHQRITAQQALCNRLTANSKSSQEYTMAELWGIKRLKAESFLYQEGSNFLQTRMNSLFF